MKILLIHNFYQQAGGEDQVFEMEARLLANHNHQVQKLTFDNRNIKTISDKIFLAYKTIYNSASVKKLENFIVNFKPEIIHVHNFFPLASPAIFYFAKKHNIKVVLTLHNFRLICSGGILLRNGKVCELCINKQIPISGIVHSCYRNSSLQTATVSMMTQYHRYRKTWNNYIDSYITFTEFSKKKFLSSNLGLDEKRIYVKPNFTSDPGKGLPANQRSDFFLFVGRLSNEKGIEMMLHSFHNTNYKLMIIGDGNLKSMVEQATLKNKNITYAGFQNKDFIFEQLKKCKALIFPSICFEGFPITIVEALITGTPVISSDLGAMSEIIANNFNGLHFEPGNTKSLSEKISLFINNPEQMFHLYENARINSLDNYSEAKNYQQLLSIYTRTIEAKNK